jgi:hypothetical protein
MNSESSFLKLFLNEVARIAISAFKLIALVFGWVCKLVGIGLSKTGELILSKINLSS